MAHKKSQEGFFSALMRIMHNYSDIMNDVLHIALLEFRILRLSVLYIAIWSGVALFFFSAVWFCFQAILVLAVNHFLANLLLSFAIVLGFNLLFVIIAAIIIIRISRNINFETTHKQLKLLH